MALQCKSPLCGHRGQRTCPGLLIIVQTHVCEVARWRGRETRGIAGTVFASIWSRVDGVTGT